MQVMYEREQPGRVEVDDAYLGGEYPGGKPGRGSENKIPFIAAVQTNKSGNPMYVVLSQVKAFTLVDVADWAKKFIFPFTTLVSDGMHCFNAVKKAGCSHQKEVVGYNSKSTSRSTFSRIIGPARGILPVVGSKVPAYSSWYAAKPAIQAACFNKANSCLSLSAVDPSLGIRRTLPPKSTPKEPLFRP